MPSFPRHYCFRPRVRAHLQHSHTTTMPTRGLSQEQKANRSNVATIWSGLTTVNALLFAAAISALFAGVPPNPALAPPPAGDRAYAVLWGLTASLHLHLAIVVTLVMSTAVMSCHDQGIYSRVKGYAWVPANATWLGGIVAYVSLMYSLFHIYGSVAGTVAVVITGTLAFICGMVSCCIATADAIKDSVVYCSRLFDVHDDQAEQDQVVERAVEVVLNYLGITRKQVADFVRTMDVVLTMQRPRSPASAQQGQPLLPAPPAPCAGGAGTGSGNGVGVGPAQV